ncbi:rCG37132 [Rattus norvegicus]|uniref:RCG37132 n=1 Tax=Rattus norvegicus TaxID=10116 RepID=A6HU41_RAT|nr:rCG37132 [Rattus norvegicus]
MKEIPIKVQEAYRTINILGQNGKSSHLIIIKTLNIQNKRKIKAAGEKSNI